MNYKEILTFFNSTFYNWSYGGISNNCILCSNENIIPRRFGKTRILNEIGLLAQSQGIEVLAWSPFYGATYTATERVNTVNDLRCHKTENTILLIDEINVKDEINARMIECLRSRGMQMFGFIRYE